MSHSGGQAPPVASRSRFAVEASCCWLMRHKPGPATHWWISLEVKAHLIGGDETGLPGHAARSSAVAGQKDDAHAYARTHPHLMQSLGPLHSYSLHPTPAPASASACCASASHSFFVPNEHVSLTSSSCSCTLAGPARHGFLLSPNRTSPSFEVGDRQC